MAEQTRYRMIHTGKEVDDLLTTIPNKLDNSLIKNDFTGGVNYVLSAEMGKVLNENIIATTNVNYLTAVFLSIPNNNLFTNALKSKLEGLDNKFKGVFDNTTLRDAALAADSATYVGGELTLVLDDETIENLQSFDYWNFDDQEWQKLVFYKLGDLTPTTIAAIGTVVYTAFNTTNYNTCRMVISASKTTSYQAAEYLIGSNGVDAYILPYGNIGNANLFTITATQVGTSVNISITTTQTNTLVKAKKIAEF